MSTGKNGVGTDNPQRMGLSVLYFEMSGASTSAPSKISATGIHIFLVGDSQMCYNSQDDTRRGGKQGYIAIKQNKNFV